MPRPRPRQNGFTLTEALLASVVLALAALAVVAPFTAGARNDQAAARQVLATTLAQELMEEILSRPFADPDDGDSRNAGPDGPAESDRSHFDNIDDYHGYTELPGQIRPRDGRPLDEQARTLQRDVTVTYVVMPGQNPADAPSFARVVVRVRDGEQDLAVLTRLVYENR